MRTAVQLYTLRGLDEPLARRLERVADAGFDGVEFAGLGDADPSDVAEAMRESNLAAAGAHVEADAAEAEPERTADAYRPLGVSTFVVPRLAPASFADVAAVDRAAGRLNSLARDLAERGGGLCYHNHEHEFVAVEGRPAFERLVESTDAAVRFELDVGWARAAGADPAALVDRYGERIPLVHLKDVALDPDAPRGGRSVDLGEGDVDLDACVAAARRADAEWLVFEHDDPADPAATLRRAATAFESLLDDSSDRRGR